MPDTLTANTLDEITAFPSVGQSQTVEIHFRRDKRFTSGRDNTAWCDIDGHHFEIPPRAGKGGGTNGGVIYRLIVQLCDAGHEGRKFTAHDGRLLCLQGVLSKKAVPAKYGGEMSV